MQVFMLESLDEPPQLTEISRPEMLGPTEVRVKVKTTSINAFDVKQLSNPASLSLPHIPGCDFAGLVDAVGSGVTTVRVGQAVMGFASRTFAEYVVVDEKRVVHKPKPLEFVEAGAIPLAGATALMCVEACAPVPGDTALIVGASGGVGSFAVQLAQVAGAHVIATGLPEDEGFLRDLGADDVVDYRSGLVKLLRASHPMGIDCLIDVASNGGVLAELCQLVTSGGRVASSVGAADVDALSERGVKATNVSSFSDPQAVARVGAYAESGDIRVPIEETYKLEELADAIEAFKTQHVRGKISIWVD